MRNKLTLYIETQPESTYKKVVLNVAEKATINETNKIITLTELQPYITRAKYLLLTISFIEGSYGCGTICTLYSKASNKVSLGMVTK